MKNDLNDIIDMSNLSWVDAWAILLYVVCHNGLFWTKCHDFWVS